MFVYVLYVSGGVGIFDNAQAAIKQARKEAGYMFPDADLNTMALHNHDQYLIAFNLQNPILRGSPAICVIQQKIRSE